MSGWAVPLSSSPPAPSTPDSRRDNISLFSNSKNGFPSNPSTTPAGPPPSSAASFTPADPPPSSVFGSSQLGSGKTLFKSKSSVGANTSSRRSAGALSSKRIDESQLARYLKSNGQFDAELKNGFLTQQPFGVPSSSPLSGHGSHHGQEQYDDEGETSEASYEEEGQEEDTFANEEVMDLRSAIDDHLPGPAFTRSLSPVVSSTNSVSQRLGSSIMDGAPRGVKRSRGGATIAYSSPHSIMKPKKTKHDSAIPSIAKDMASQFGIAKVDESDQFIVRTEDILQQELYSTELLGDAHEQVLNSALPNVAEKLSNFWRSCVDQDEADMPLEADSIIGIGPDERSPPMHKAVFVGALLLQLHHPPTAKGKQAFAVSRLNLSSVRSQSSHILPIPNPTALPKVLIDWLDVYHNPYQSAIIDLQNFHPNPTAHPDFWDMITASTLRGKLKDVIRLFKVSNFRYARTAREDGQGDNAYNDTQVKNIERVINKAIEVLGSCPSLQDDDWNITGNEWTPFRKRVEQAIENLSMFAEGRDRDMDPEEASFEASNFGLRSTTTAFSQSARKAESRVPWTVYQHLKTTYSILLGGADEILTLALDWVEAAISMTVWWDGNDEEDIEVGSLAMTRRSLRKSQSRASRLVDENPSAAYIRRLCYAFQRATDDSDERSFQVSTINQVQVGLASVFEGNVEGVIRLLRCWSLPVASSVAEIASTGRWFGPVAGTDVINGFDESDLMVLSSYGEREQPISRDTILVEYADALSLKDTVRAEQKNKIYEGWELSIPLLTRLDNEGVATKRVGEILNQLSLNSDARMDKILNICQRFGMAKEARGITERYADHVAENSDNYGTVLVYYARAHCRKKVKDVLDLLISLSLVQSIAYPPLPALDTNLRAFLFDPKESLEQLAITDPEAAKMLHTYLTGYATLRRFYDLRDEEANLEAGQKSTLRPNERKIAAAKALLAVVNSAADNIHGGLYDETRGSVVQVDGLLVLLGEAMVFVNQSKSILDLPQCFALLKAIEDLQTVTPRVFEQCEQCLHSTMVAFKGKDIPTSPRHILKKQVSSMTSASSFSLVGSSILDLERGNGMDGNSKALVKSQETTRRGWDWRQGIPEDGKGEDVLRILRLGLAKDIARHWIETS